VISQTFYPTKYVLQAGAHRDIFSVIGTEFSRLFVVTGKKAMHEAGVLKRLEDQCFDKNIELHIYRGVTTNPTHAEVDGIVAACKSFGADAVMGLGGGSSIDIAKMVAMLCSNPGSCWDYISVSGRKGRKIEKRDVRLFALPTTSGAGSETTPYAVITHAETLMKKGMGSPHLYPDVAIIDAELLALMPQEQVAVTGFDAFGQALEGFTSGKSTLHSEFYGLNALRYITKHFEDAYSDPKNLTAKEGMAWGASLAGLSIGLVDVNLAHAISHPLSGRYNIQHGLAVALCTAPAIWFNRHAVGDKYVQVASMLGSHCCDKDEAALVVIKYFQGLASKFGIDLALRNHGIPQDALDLLAEEAMEIGAIRTNVIDVSQADVRALLGLVWRGAYA